MKKIFISYKVIIIMLLLVDCLLGYKLHIANANCERMLQENENQKSEIEYLKQIIELYNEDRKDMTNRREIEQVSIDNESIIDEAFNESGSYLMSCRITHYSSEETGSDITASGKIAQLNHTIACNTLPFGTKVRINGIIYTVEDTGDMDGNGIDIYVSSADEAYELGTYITEVEVL